MNNDILQQFTGILPTVLGRRFRLGDDPTIFQVVGLKGRSNDVVLQMINSDEYRTISAVNFQKLAIRADE